MFLNFSIEKATAGNEPLATPGSARPPGRVIGSSWLTLPSKTSSSETEIDIKVPAEKTSGSMAT